jgi:hypothetical protein
MLSSISPAPGSTGSRGTRGWQGSSQMPIDQRTPRAPADRVPLGATAVSRGNGYRYGCSRSTSSEQISEHGDVIGACWVGPDVMDHVILFLAYLPVGERAALSLGGGERSQLLAAGEGRRIVGGSLDATVKMTLDGPASTSTFEVVIGRALTSAPTFTTCVCRHQPGTPLPPVRGSRCAGPFKSPAPASALGEDRGWSDWLGRPACVVLGHGAGRYSCDDRAHRYQSRRGGYVESDRSPRR